MNFSWSSWVQTNSGDVVHGRQRRWLVQRREDQSRLQYRPHVSHRYKPETKENLHNTIVVNESVQFSCTVIDVSKPAKWYDLWWKWSDARSIFTILPECIILFKPSLFDFLLNLTVNRISKFKLSSSPSASWPVARDLLGMFNISSTDDSSSLCPIDHLSSHQLIFKFKHRWTNLLHILHYLKIQPRFDL